MAHWARVGGELRMRTHASSAGRTWWQTCAARTTSSRTSRAADDRLRASTTLIIFGQVAGAGHGGHDALTRGAAVRRPDQAKPPQQRDDLIELVTVVLLDPLEHPTLFDLSRSQHLKNSRL